MFEQTPTLSLVFESQAKKYRDLTFLKDKRNKAWVNHSWTEVAEAAGKLRAGLANIGVKPGDRIAILSENCPEWIAVDQAVLGLGGIVVPLYTTSGTEETAHVINDCGAKIVAVNGPEMIKKLVALKSSIPGVTTLIAMHSGAESQPASETSPAIMTIGSVCAETQAAPIAGGRGDVATIIYTSGTTGVSKGVMLTHGNILANCEDAMTILSLNETDMTLSFLPIAHSFERTAGYYTVVCGGAVIAFAEGLTQIASNLLEVEPTVMLTVPRLLEVVYARAMRSVEASSGVKRRLFNDALSAGKRAAEHRNLRQPIPVELSLSMAVFRRLVFSKIKSVFGKRLRYLISGGAPLPREINEFLAAAEVPIVEGYGLTEAGPIVSCNLHEGKTRFGTVGMALPHVQTEIAPDGELLVRGPSIMKGYYNREAETKEVIDDKGWLHTGDIASIDAEGYISITDRKKEIIVLSGGKNVSPAYVESKLLADKHISQACVVGDRRKHLAALLVPDFENLADFLKTNNLDAKNPETAKAPALRQLIQERIREINRNLSDVEAIVAFAIVPQFTQENGELTPSLKVRRKMVQAHYKDLIDSLYGG
ncbi:MAG TPA: long-chain fatty acid--CoA ligase [Candidatus Binataceae bacterium]|nr:long-chain fatty acid--CoA ligase [Candidatus Binataceae bacterium]